MRKKARHEELEQREKELESFLDSKQLEKGRIECLEQFIAVRQNMMNTSAVMERDDSSDTIGERLLRDIVIDPLHSFVLETRGPPSVSCEMETSPVAKMKHWDQQLRWKIFESIEISSSTFFAYEVQDGVDGIAISKNGSSYAQINLVLYQMDGDNRSSTLLSTKKLMMNTNKSKRDKIVLLKILMKAQFGVDDYSSKLTSMEWIIIEACQCLTEKERHV